MPITIKLRRTTKNFDSVTTVPAAGEPVFNLTDDTLVIGNGSSQVSTLPRAQFFSKGIATNQFFRGGGSNNYPTFSELSASDIPNLSTSKLTSGVLSAARGGTGVSSLTTGGILYGASGNKVATTPVGTVGQVLRSNGSLSPYWSNTNTMSVDRAEKDGQGDVIVSTYVKKTDVANKGSSTTPVYFNSDGKAVALNYTLAKSVPSNAKFTDTTYTQGSGIAINTTQINNTGVLDVTESTINGNISVTLGSSTGTSTTKNVPVKGYQKIPTSTVVLSYTHNGVSYPQSVRFSTIQDNFVECVLQGVVQFLDWQGDGGNPLWIHSANMESTWGFTINPGGDPFNYNPATNVEWWYTLLYNHIPSAAPSGPDSRLSPLIIPEQYRPTSSVLIPVQVSNEIALSAAGFGGAPTQVILSSNGYICLRVGTATQPVKSAASRSAYSINGRSIYIQKYT